MGNDPDIWASTAPIAKQRTQHHVHLSGRLALQPRASEGIPDQILVLLAVLVGLLLLTGWSWYWRRPPPLSFALPMPHIGA